MTVSISNHQATKQSPRVIEEKQSKPFGNLNSVNVNSSKCFIREESLESLLQAGRKSDKSIDIDEYVNSESYPYALPKLEPAIIEALAELLNKSVPQPPIQSGIRKNEKLKLKFGRLRISDSKGTTVQ
jgi:hypothetical protein